MESGLRTIGIESVASSATPFLAERAYYFDNNVRKIERRLAYYRVFPNITASSPKRQPQP
jgi:hypothetical protein